MVSLLGWTFPSLLQ